MELKEDDNKFLNTELLWPRLKKTIAKFRKAKFLGRAKLPLSLRIARFASSAGASPSQNNLSNAAQPSIKLSKPIAASNNNGKARSQVHQQHRAAQEFHQDSNAASLRVGLGSSVLDHFQ